MKNIKSLLAFVMAICLMMCLAVPAFAAETTGAAEETTAATTGAAEETTGAAEETTAATEAHDHDHDHEKEESTTTTGTKEEESAGKKALRITLTVLEVLASIALVVVVLMQSGKEAGLSGALTGNTDSYLNKSGAAGLDKLLAKSTKWIALVWLVLTLILSLI